MGLLKKINNFNFFIILILTQAKVNNKKFLIKSIGIFQIVCNLLACLAPGKLRSGRSPRQS